MTSAIYFFPATVLSNRPVSLVVFSHESPSIAKAISGCVISIPRTWSVSLRMNGTCASLCKSHGHFQVKSLVIKLNQQTSRYLPAIVTSMITEMRILSHLKEAICLQNHKWLCICPHLSNYVTMFQFSKYSF